MKSLGVILITALFISSCSKQEACYCNEGNGEYEYLTPSTNAQNVGKRYQLPKEAFLDDLKPFVLRLSYYDNIENGAQPPGLWQVVQLLYNAGAISLKVSCTESLKKIYTLYVEAQVWSDRVINKYR